MGIAKKTDGRYVVGVGVDNANDYRGSAAYRDIYIQLTSSGATEQSEEYLTFLKDYAVNANALGEPIMPPSVNVWISNNGVTTAVEADDVSIDGNNYTICGIKWNGSTWDYSGAGQGKSGSGLPPYTSADKGKFLGLGEAEPVETEVVVVPEQSVTVTETDGGVIANEGSLSSLSVGDNVSLFVNGVEYPSTVYEGAAGVGVGPDDETIGYTVEQVMGDSPTTHKTLFTAFDGEGDNIPGTYSVSVKEVQSVTPSVQTVIVPEQTVTTGTAKTFFGANGYYTAEISGGDFSGVSVGDSVIITVDGTDYQCNVTEEGNDLLIASDPVAYGVAVGSNWAIFLSATGKSTTYTISVSKSAPKLAPKWERDKVVLASSNAALTHLQTKVQAAFTSFFASADNKLYSDNSTNILTDADLANIDTAYTELSSGNTNVVVNSLGTLFNIVSATPITVTFCLPYMAQNYSSILVAARITIMLGKSSKEVNIVAEKIRDNRW